MCDYEGEFASTTRDGITLVWNVARLWDLAQNLPVSEVPMASLEPLLDTVCWFNVGGQDNDENLPTARAVAIHSERIHSADLSHPLILSADGEVMDGMHRLAKAWMLGNETIQVVRFYTDPPPDHTEPFNK